MGHSWLWWKSLWFRAFEPSKKVYKMFFVPFFGSAGDNSRNTRYGGRFKLKVAGLVQAS
ncbi:hypothetical protein T4D_14796 [Trichinella pseudospiralis]|uniref:Uncharacterized protein n=1 Tax=Trichinella pseudospiralis TaxID=6337 RepID=A0A0V1FV19_TRIPS|nr:hypothetical protein T4D_14796 [Trichinella pseudospiralis]